MKSKYLIIIISVIVTAICIGIFFVARNSNSEQIGGKNSGTATEVEKDEVFSVGDVVMTRTKANLRSSPAINNGLLNNLIQEEFEGVIGTIQAEYTGEDGFKWYKIKLTKPIKKGLKTHNYAYCRIDVITKK